MPYNGAGNFVSLPPPQYPAVPGDVIRAAYFNAVINDLIAGLTNVITRDGQSPPTSNLPMGAKKHTGVADATAADQYAAYGQLINSLAIALFKSAFAGSVNRTAQSKLADIVHAADFGVVSDGITDQTTAITTVLTTLGAASFRGILQIPANTKFSPTTVMAAVPTGVGVRMVDTVNWGQPPTYKNKFEILYYGDTVSDDAQQIIGSGHHPAFMTLNMGTAGSVAASSRYGTWLHGVGRDVNGDPLLGWVQQFAKSPSTNTWRTSWRLQTPYSVAIANPSNWTAAQVVAAGSYRLSDGGKVYKTVAGGTCGGVAPTGTGTGINDGGVLWDYVQAALNIDSTRMDLDENGNFGLYGPANVNVTWAQQSGSRQHTISVDGTTNEILWRDSSRALDVLRVGDAFGLRIGTAMSANRVAMSGATPDAPLTGFGRVSNGGATNMTKINRPAGRTQMRIELRFDDGNTTVVHNVGAADQFKLKGSVNATPTSGSFMLFELDTTTSSVWQEVYRSF